MSTPALDCAPPTRGARFARIAAPAPGQPALAVLPGTPAESGAAVRAALPLVLIALTLMGPVSFFRWAMWHGAYTPDFPWLWRAGQYILESGELPVADIFSWTFAGRPWVLYQWLFEVAIAKTEQWVGMRGLFAVYAGVALTIYLVAPFTGAVPRRVSPLTVAPIAALGLLVVLVNLSLRPMIVTAALLLVQYMALQRLRCGRSGLWTTALLLAPLYALWGNMHTGVVLGLASLALAAVGDLAERRGLYSFDPVDPQIEGRPLPWPRYLLLLTVAFLASLLNPYGVGIYDYIVDLSSESFLNDAIVELASPDFHRPQFLCYLVFVATFAALLTRAGRCLSAGDLLHLVVFTFATFYAARFVVWSVLFFVLILPRALHHVSAGGSGSGAAAGAGLLSGLRAGAMRATVAVVSFLPSSGLWLAPSETPFGGACAPLLPAIAAYADLKRPEDRLFNDAVAGSCLLAQDPAQKVFIDTRFDFYGADFVAETTRALMLRPGWDRTLARWRIDTALLGRKWPLAQALEADPGFAVLFDDGQALVLRRRPAEPTTHPDR